MKRGADWSTSPHLVVREIRKKEVCCRMDLGPSNMRWKSDWCVFPVSYLSPSEGFFCLRVVGDVEVEGIHSNGRSYIQKDGANVMVATEELLLV